MFKLCPEQVQTGPAQHVVNHVSKYIEPPGNKYGEHLRHDQATIFDLLIPFYINVDQ